MHIINGVDCFIDSSGKEMISKEKRLFDFIHKIWYLIMTDRAHVQVSRDEHRLLSSIWCEETQSVLISPSSEL